MTSPSEQTVQTAEETAMMAPFDALVEAHGVHRTFACTLNNIGAMLYERRRYGAAMGHYQESIQFRTAVRTGTKPTAANGPNENGHPIAPDPSDIPTLTARAVEVWRYYSALSVDDEFGILYPSDDSSCSDADSSDESSDSDMRDQVRGCSSDDKDDEGPHVMDLRRPACPTIGMFQKNEYSDEGPQWFQSAVHFTAEVMGDCAYESAVTLFNMGLIEMKRNKAGNNSTERAEQLFEMALSLAPGKHYDVIAPVLNNLGRLYYSTGNYADAADAFSEAVELGAEVVKDLPLPTPPNEKRISVSKSLSTRSLMSTSSSSDDNSEFSSSTSSPPQDSSSFPRDVVPPMSFGCSNNSEQQDTLPHHLLATSTANLARAHQRQQELPEALEHSIQALRLRRLLHHETHYLVQVATYNVGMLRHQMNDHGGALACYRGFLTWAAGTVGPRHVLSATVMHDLATVLFDRRNLAGAMPLLLRSLAVREAELGPDHQDVAEVLYSVGRLLHDREEYGDAAEVYGRALRIQERRLGRTHPDVVRTLCNIGRVSHVRGDVVGALEATSRVVAIVQGSEGNESFLSSTLNFLGNIYLEVGETRLAMSCFAESRNVASGGATVDGHHHVTPSIFVSPLHYRGFNRAHGAAASA